MPAVIKAQQAHQDVGVAYMLAVCQTLALGSLLGLSQEVVLRAYTPRWAWWIAANLVSWLIVDLVVVVIQHINPFDFSHGKDSIAELYLMLVATTPLPGRAILWVLAPSVVSGKQVAATSRRLRLQTSMCTGSRMAGSSRTRSRALRYAH